MQYLPRSDRQAKQAQSRVNIGSGRRHKERSRGKSAHHTPRCRNASGPPHNYHSVHHGSHHRRLFSPAADAFILLLACLCIQPRQLQIDNSYPDETKKVSREGRKVYWH